jgi:ribosome-associated toxin RatA of RatAB toxin-antitoxin module
MPYSSAKIYAVVEDIASYPEFLPWCGGTRILAQQENCVDAEITIAKGPVRVAFATTNQLRQNERIDMRLKNGPFKQLSGFWLFESIGEDVCRVSLKLDFEFNNRLLAMTVGAVFEQVIGSLIDAFLVRATSLYGK